MVFDSHFRPYLNLINLIMGLTRSAQDGFSFFYLLVYTLSMKKIRSEPTDLARALRLSRVFIDMKAVELAKELKVSPGYLSEVESGKKVPSMPHLVKHADALGIKLSTLLSFSEQIKGVTQSRDLMKIYVSFHWGDDD